MPNSKSKQAELVAACKAKGLTVSLTKNLHWKIITPNGAVFMPSTPSEHSNGWKKDRARLRRMGVDI